MQRTSIINTARLVLLTSLTIPLIFWSICRHWLLHCKNIFLVSIEICSIENCTLQWVPLPCFPDFLSQVLWHSCSFHCSVQGCLMGYLCAFLYGVLQLHQLCFIMLLCGVQAQYLCLCALVIPAKCSCECVCVLYAVQWSATWEVLFPSVSKAFVWLYFVCCSAVRCVEFLVGSAWGAE